LAWLLSPRFPVALEVIVAAHDLEQVNHPRMRWPQLYFGVALTSVATLLLELSLTRIFSVVFYYHFAFLAISIALFGLGAGGVFSYVVARWRGPMFARLGWLSAVNSLVVILVLVWLLGTKQSPWELPLTYSLAALPFFLAGAIVSLAISETIQNVDRVYFFDLGGAAAGCLILIPLLNYLGGPGTVMSAAVLFAAAAAVWHNMAGSNPGRTTSVALALALIAFTVYNASHNLIDVRYNHVHKKVEDAEFVKWNSFSRVSVRVDDMSIHRIFIDEATSTPITTFDLASLTARDREDLLEPSSALACSWRPGAKALVIGPGGGLEVARCLALGSKDITGVEINPIIATTIMREKYADLSHRVYLRPEVHIVEEDGRTFVRRSHEKYQVMQLTLIGNWGSTNAGAYSLTENSLYTVEAFRDYLGHLTDDGLLTLTRWTFHPPRESLRLVSLAMEALTQLGEPEPWRHVIVVQERGGLDTLLISRQPFPEADLARARAALAGNLFQAAYLPGDVGHGTGSEFADLLRSPDRLGYERQYLYDITPVTDNRPFFFYFVQPRDLWSYLTHTQTGYTAQSTRNTVVLLFGLMGLSIMATLVMLVLPPVVLGTRLPSRKGSLVPLLYFVFIGAGYILVEVALVQRFILLLGHPTYALTVVIFSMLVSSGLGSRFSRRLLHDSLRRLANALGIIAILVSLLGVLTWFMLAIAVGLPLWLKVATTILTIFPAAFVMGMPFPTALRWLEGWHQPSVRWAWSLNAAASVLGSVGALMCAIYLGLLQTLIVGGLLYLAALVVVWRLFRREAAEPTFTAGPVTATVAGQA
jgi:predicted membrane-bound spermidine synthase